MKILKTYQIGNYSPTNEFQIFVKPKKYFTNNTKLKGNYIILFLKSSPYKVKVFLREIPSFKLVKCWVIVHIDAIKDSIFSEYKFVRLLHNDIVYYGFMYLDGIT